MVAGALLNAQLGWASRAAALGASYDAVRRLAVGEEPGGDEVGLVAAVDAAIAARLARAPPRWTPQGWPELCANFDPIY